MTANSLGNDQYSICQLLGFGMWFAMLMALSPAIAQEPQPQSKQQKQTDPGESETKQAEQQIQHLWEQIQSLHHRRRFEQAEPIARQALTLSLSKLPPHSWHVINSRTLLSQSLRNRRRHAEAEEQLRQTLNSLKRDPNAEPSNFLLNRLLDLANVLQAQQKSEEALQACRQASQVHESVSDSPGFASVRLYRQTSVILSGMGQHAEAARMRKQEVDQLRAADETHSSDLADALCRWSHSLSHSEPGARARAAAEESLERRTALLDSDQEITDSQRLGLSASLHAVAFAATRSGDPSAAVSPLRKAIAYRQEVIPDGDAATARLVTLLVDALVQLQRFDEAADLIEATWKRHVEIRGPDDQEALAWFAEDIRRLQDRLPFARWEPLMRKVIEGYQTTFGERHAKTILLEEILARKLDHQSRFVESLVIRYRILELVINRYGEQHPRTATAYNNLGITLSYQQQDARALEMYERAIAISRAHEGTSPISLGYLLHNLGGPLQGVGRLEEAIAAVEEAIALHQSRADHPRSNVGLFRNTLAVLLSQQGRNEEAAEIYQELKAEWSKTGGPANIAQQNLAIMNYKLHRYREAIDLLRPQLDDTHGRPSHAALLQTHYLLGFCNLFTGNVEQAENHFMQAQQEYEFSRREWAFSGLSRSTSNLNLPAEPLAVLAARKQEPERAWQLWESVRAEGLVEELQTRVGLEPSPTYARHQQLVQQMERLEQAVSNPKTPTDEAADFAHQYRGLQTQRAEIEQQLLNMTTTSQEPANLTDVQNLLSPDEAFVGWVEPFPEHRPGFSQGHYGVVVRAEGPPVWIELSGSGPSGTWTEEDRSVHELLAEQLADPLREAEATQLPILIKRWRELRLEPLQSALGEAGGLPVARHLTVISSTATRGVSLQALTDDHSISYVPSATTLQWLKQRRKRRQQERKHERSQQDSLLALADPTLESDQWPELPGTRVEVTELAKPFIRRGATVKQLFGEEAHELAIRRMAESGELSQYRYLHLASHGIVDPNRPLRSALLLAAPPDDDISADGRLTAGEILSSWQLQAELAVLSACQTGLGRFSQTEGHIGFAQSLLISGADSVVLSLWKVDDTATSLLMQRFYQNLLGSRDDLSEPLTKRAALYEAQQWLRELSAEQVDQRLAGLPQVHRGTKTRRPVLPQRLIKASQSDPDVAIKPFADPTYWSAFVLIGLSD